MSKIAIKVENLSKLYHLGAIGYGTLRGDLKSAWMKARNKQSSSDASGNPVSSEHENDFWALRDINFELEEGMRLGVIGRNGAGKSTLLKILSRVTGPTTGRAQIRGKVASLLEVGTGFNSELSGRENIFLNGAILGMKRREIQRKFDEIVDFSGVEQFIDTPVKRYSSGMYVRLAFAVSAHLESEILILDEVLAVGDANFQKKSIKKMNELSTGEGRTLIFVSHNSAAVSSLCQKAIFLEKGRVIQMGPVNEILTQYLRNNESLGDIRNHPLKEGSGEIEIVSLEFYTRGKRVTEFYCGDDLEVVFGYERKKNFEGGLNISLMIMDLAGIPVALIHNRLAKAPLALGQESGTVRATLKEVNLIPSIYKVGYSVMITAQGEERFVDRLSPAAEVTVLPSAYSPSGEFPPEGFGPVFLNSLWIES